MITCKELREISLTFRRLSSNFLNSTDKDASTLIQRFKEYIDNTPFIAELIKKTTQGVEYDYLECFVQKAHGGWSEIRPPVNEACHIKAMYDYLSLIAGNGGNVLGAAMSYYHPSNTFRDIIRSFLDSALQRLTKGNIKTTTKWTVNLTENAARLHKRAAFLRDRERRKTYPRAGLK